MLERKRPRIVGGGPLQVKGRLGNVMVKVLILDDKGEGGTVLSLALSRLLQTD